MPQGIPHLFLIEIGGSSVNHPVPGLKGIGHLSLLQNPVMRLSPHDFGKCVCDMERLRQVSEHTARLNFSSFSYFSRYVSRHFGISPNAYRESLNRVR